MGRLISGAIIVFVVLLFVPLFLEGEDTNIKPTEPEITLPPLLLEVEDLSIKNITVPLPEEEITPPEIELPIPENLDLDLKESLGDIEPVPGGIEGQSVSRNKIQTEVTLGLGTLNNFLSNVSVSSFGGNPEGKLNYKHEAADKFSGKPSSMGYGSRSDSMYAYLSYRLNNLNFNVESSFDETEFGLQGNTDYYSKINRFVNLNMEAKYKTPRDFSISGGLNTNVANQNLTGGSSPYGGVVEYSVKPEVRVKYNFNRGSVTAFTYLEYFTSPDISSYESGYFGLGINVDYEIFKNTTIQFNTRGVWNNEHNAFLPFYLKINSDITDYFTLHVMAGYNIKQNALYNTFKEYPFIDVPQNGVGIEKNWSVSLGGQWTSIPNWIITSSLEYKNFKDRVNESKDVNSDGLFNYYLYSGNTLAANIGARWVISDIYSARFGIKAKMGDLSNNEAKFYGNASFEGLSTDGKLGGNAELVYSFYNIGTADMPELNLSIFYSPKEYLKFSLDVNDIAILLKDNRRYFLYPYLDRGFYIMLKTSILF